MPRSSPRSKVLLLSRRTWLAIAIAFLLGLLLFLAIWIKQRHDNDFYRADTPQSATGQAFEPLPAPDTADGTNQAQATPSDQAPPSSAQIEASPPAPDATETSPDLPATEPPPAQAATAGDKPVAIYAPAPRYPPEALRNGESGEALVRIQVGANGIPAGVALIRSSGSRTLDRAAMEIVRRWRFQPAQSGGQPVEAEVQVPIAFNAQR